MVFHPTEGEILELLAQYPKENSFYFTELYDLLPNPDGIELERKLDRLFRMGYLNKDIEYQGNGLYLNKWSLSDLARH